MDIKNSRRKIIDSSLVPSDRRLARRPLNGYNSPREPADVIADIHPDNNSGENGTQNRADDVNVIWKPNAKIEHNYSNQIQQENVIRSRANIDNLVKNQHAEHANDHLGNSKKDNHGDSERAAYDAAIRELEYVNKIHEVPKVHNSERDVHNDAIQRLECENAIPESSKVRNSERDVDNDAIHKIVSARKIHDVPRNPSDVMRNRLAVTVNRHSGRPNVIGDATCGFTEQKVSNVANKGEECAKGITRTGQNGVVSYAKHPEYKTILQIKKLRPGEAGSNSRKQSSDSFRKGETLLRGGGNIQQLLRWHRRHFLPSLKTISELDTSDPHSVELGHVARLFPDVGDSFVLAVANTTTTEGRDLVADMYREFTTRRESLDIEEVDARALVDELEVYSDVMEGGVPKLLSVEEKWQIIFNEKTRAPIYAVGQYIDYLEQFVNGKPVTSRDTGSAIRKDGISPMSYLLRKLKLDLKMSYDSFIDEFLKPGTNGMSFLVKLLKTIQDTGTQQSGSTNMTQLKNYKKTLTDEHDCLLCIKYALRLKNAVSMLLEITYGVETVAMSLLSNFTKSRGTAIEILTVALCTNEGFSRILDCFAFVRLKVGESVRFKSLMNMLNMEGGHNTVFKVSTMKFLNSLLDAATNLNIRVFLQYELESAGFDADRLLKTATGNGLEYDDLRFELARWDRKYTNVDALVSKTGVPREQETTHLNTIEDLKHKVKVLSHEKAQTEQKLKAVRSELKICFEELQNRNPMTRDSGTQYEPRTRPECRSVSCQCRLPEPISAVYDTKHGPTADHLGWNMPVPSKSVPHPDGSHYVSGHYGEEESADEESVEKVQYWLKSNYSSESDLNILPHFVKDSQTGTENTLYFKRQPSIRIKRPKKSDFPGNWKLAPKTLENFPSRLPAHVCHQTNCDRCDVRNRPENARHHRGDIVLQHVTADFPAPSTSRHGEVSVVYDAKSQSSDSAIGGSGERLWNSKNRRIPLSPVDADEAELLQDMIQPDDSASGVVVAEPYPDYSVVDEKYRTQKSYKTEISRVLREFEGNLNLHDNPDHHYYVPLLPVGHS